MKSDKFVKIDFSKFSSIKIGSKINVKIVNENNYEGEFLIGKATNTLISPYAKNLGILDDRYKFLKIEGNFLRVGAKVKNRVLYNFCKKNDIGGFEFLAKLPGSIGGSVRMNAGVKKEEISNNLIAIKSLSGWVEKQELGFDYRSSNIKSPVFEVMFEIKRKYDAGLDMKLAKMRENQPSEPSLGSVFKNPKGDFAGRLIEAVGLKGKRKGDILISPKHANFFVNIGEGRYEDMIFLINLAKKRVFEEFGVELKEEIIII